MTLKLVGQINWYLYSWERNSNEWKFQSLL